jgi:hypothetical protein
MARAFVAQNRGALERLLEIIEDLINTGLRTEHETGT